ncbi:hypothetical protein N7523_010263 [Penicillium sp. IBT 18751x]|nr:hypothetical protein N7523_010263 [Penicillium sp. IBT 18751x]
MMLIKRYLLPATIANWAVSAHMIMTFPEPYSKGSLNNSPLAADGSDFPCKLRPNAFELPAEETMIGVGDSHQLSFQGSATHGGGSCQISLTSDREPSKSSQWKVIKSFEGGCPANVNGNLAGGPTSTDPYTFDFAIPKGIAPGNYTLAWTWFNRLGNREMYMNCAPITVTSSSTKRSSAKMQGRTSAFPPMFVANVNGCITKEGVDIRFPQPGGNVEYNGQAANLAAKDEAACIGDPIFGGSAITNANSAGSVPSGGSAVAKSNTSSTALTFTSSALIASQTLSG